MSTDMDTHPKKKALVNLRSPLQKRAALFNRPILHYEPTVNVQYRRHLTNIYLKLYCFALPLLPFSVYISHLFTAFLFKPTSFLTLALLNIFKFKRSMSHRFTKTLLNHFINTIYYTFSLALLDFLHTMGSQPSNKENRHWLLTHGEGLEPWQRDTPLVLVPSALAPVTFEFS